MTGPDPVLLAIGARLRATRGAYGDAIGVPKLSGARFAAEFGLHPATYSRYERGEVAAPLEFWIGVRKLTGVSLDRLLADMPPGTDAAEVASRDVKVTLGMRLRWAREVMLPDLEGAAELMATPAEVWAKYEKGEEEPPASKMQEFAHRFSVTMDFLYSGHLKGVPYPVKRALLKMHPVLGRTVGSHTDKDFGKPLQAKGSNGSDRPQTVEAEKTE